ncbi:prolyl oligopeptidase family serine peptidase [Yoonia sp. 2307UL14-13]|uniref:prolyl oligopeptidase family serine peptidase n=1 Tax=Yoonia sp. 2307UL14-13 TaxID=3126506 RepID=UPI0030AA3878
MADFIFPELENDDDAIAAFVAAQNTRTEGALQDDVFATDVNRAAKVLEDPDNLGGIVRRGDWVFNFRKDADHPRGVWRRIPDGVKPTVDADWQVVFDLDAFCKETGEDWHWRGPETLWSEPTRVLLALSYQGSDQTRYLEWDCDAQAAVPDGFDIAPARSSVAWLDANTILMSNGAVAATRSGWPRQVASLQRGQAPEDAKVIFEVEESDLLAFGYTFPLSDGTRGIGLKRVRAIGDDLGIVRIGKDEVSLTAPAGTVTIHNHSHYAYVAADDGPDPAGTLVLQRLDGSQRRVMFKPTERRAVDVYSIAFTKNHIFWIEQDTLQPTLIRLDLRDVENQPEALPLPVDAQSIWVGHYDAEADDGPLQMVTSGFLTPSQTWLFDGDATHPVYELLVESTRSFDSTGMEVRLHMATSDDGTEVPYHIVLPKDHDGDLPVLQYGYGGFSNGLSPYYLRMMGPLWLEKGGAYVLTYVRGGSEFGKSWHLAAKGQNRPRAFEDFAAIANDLVERGYATPERIACHGGSNGGLLCGVMLTSYPERFGAVWASVGVMDMLRFHLFPAGAGWIDEYGDPDNPKARAWLRAYSPLHNVVPYDQRTYPPALIDTNDSDDRVDPSHSRRFAAALAAAGQPFWFHSRSGGHGGGGQTTETAKELALGIAFLRKTLSL